MKRLPFVEFQADRLYQKRAVPILEISARFDPVEDRMQDLLNVGFFKTAHTGSGVHPDTLIIDRADGDVLFRINAIVFAGANHGDSGVDGGAEYCRCVFEMALFDL